MLQALKNCLFLAGFGLGSAQLGLAEVRTTETVQQRLGVVWVTWNADGFDRWRQVYDDIVGIGFQRVTITPTWFMENLNQIDFNRTGSFEKQRPLVQALIGSGIEVEYRPHLDPAMYSWGLDGRYEKYN